MMGICHPFAQMFKFSGLMWSLKAFILNFLSPLYKFMLKPLDFYMLVTVWIYLVILFVLFEIPFSSVRKVILDDFVCSKGILII